MKLTIGEAREFVRARLDELAAQGSDMLLGSIDDRNLDNTIDKLLEDAITFIHLAAPASLMEGPMLTESNFPAGALDVSDQVLDIDTAQADTSDDILRLISFRCGDSDIKLTSAFYEDSPEARMQLNRYIQGQPDSPVLVQLDDSPNYKPRYKYYTTGMRLDGQGQSLHFVLRYFPRPKLTGGSGGTFSVSPDSVVLSPSGSSRTISVSASQAWTLSKSASWIILSAEGGSAGSGLTFTISADSNTGGQRDGTVIVSCGGETRSISVSQGSLADITVTPSSLIFPAGMNTQQVTVTSSLPWSITSNIPDWLFVAERSGVGTSTFNISTPVGRNPERSTSLVFENSTGSFVVEVTQRAYSGSEGNDQLRVASTAMSQNGVIRLPSTEVETVYYISVAATEGLEWRAALSDTVNFYIAPTSGVGSGISNYSNVAVRATNPNNTGQARTATVTFSATGVDPVVVTLRQPSALTVTPRLTSVTSAAGSLQFQVSTESEWTVSLLDDPDSHPEGFSLSTYSGNGNGTITCSYPANNGTKTRLLSFRVTGGGTTVQVVISQSPGTEESISVNPARLGPYPASGDLSGAAVTATVTASSAWVLATPSEDWVVVRKLTGSNTIEITYLGENTDTVERRATVDVYLASNQQKRATLVIRQTAAVEPVIDITDTIEPIRSLTVEASGGSFRANLTASGAWTLSTQQSWIHITSASSGTGNAIIYFTVDARTTGTGSLDGAITAVLTGKNKQATYSITQLPPEVVVPTIELTRLYTSYYDYVEIPASAPSHGTLGDGVQIHTEGNWTLFLRPQDTWVHPSGAWSGSGNAQAWYTVDNNTGSERTAVITGQLSTGQTATFQIRQAAGDGSRSLSAYFDKANIDADAQTTHLTINTQQGITWSISNVSPGLTLETYSGSGPATITVAVSQNTGSSPRTLSLEVSDDFYGMSTTASLRQEASGGGGGQYLSLSPSGETDVASDDTSLTIGVVSNVSWSATTSSAGVVLSPSSGSNDGSITATFGPNNDSTRRDIVISVSGGGITKTLTIRQAPSSSSSLSVSPTSVILSPGGGSQAINVSASQAWTLSKSDSWITLNKNGGDAGSGLTFIISANANTGNQRSGSVTVSCGGEIKTVLVIQGTIADISLTPEDITLGAARNSTKNISVFATGPWEVDEETSDIPAWLGYSYRSSHDGSTTGEVLVFTALSENTEPGERSTTVTIRLIGVADADPATVTVRQDGILALTISPTSATSDARNDSGTINVVSNTGWEIVQVSDGISIDSEDMSGSRNGTVDWYLSGNPHTTQRTLTVTFQTTDGSVVRTFTVTQAGGTLAASINSLAFAASGEDKSLVLMSSAPWEVQSKPSWISLIRPDAGMANTPSGIGVTIRASENTSTASGREGQIVFRHTNSYITETVTVSQSPATEDTLEIDPNEDVNLPSSDGATVSLDITSSTDWLIDLSQTFGITASAVSGTGNDTVTLTVPANTGLYNRKHVVKVKTVDGSKSRSLNIWQPAPEPSITLEPDVDELVFDENTVGTLYVVVHSNVRWTAVQSDLWINASVFSGAAGEDVVVEFTPDQSSTRIQEGTYTITGEGGVASRTLTIKTLPPSPTLHPGWQGGGGSPSGGSPWDENLDPTYSVQD